MRTWHGGGATHISRCPPASTGLPRPGTRAATGGERGGSGPGLLPGRSAAVCPFSSSSPGSGPDGRCDVMHARRVLGESKAGRSWGNRTGWVACQ